LRSAAPFLVSSALAIPTFSPERLLYVTVTVNGKCLFLRRVTQLLRQKARLKYADTSSWAQRKVMDTALTMLLLPVALAAGLWWLDRANDTRPAERNGAVRRTFTDGQARSVWIKRKSGKPAGEPLDATDEPAGVLELEVSGDFRVPKKPYYQRQSKD
jgi:hypothetical protein